MEYEKKKGIVHTFINSTTGSRETSICKRACNSSLVSVGACDCGALPAFAAVALLLSELPLLLLLVLGALWLVLLALLPVVTPPARRRTACATAVLDAPSTTSTTTPSPSSTQVGTDFTG